MAQQIPNMNPTSVNEIAELLSLYNESKAKEIAAKQAADVLKSQIEQLLHDCDLAHVAGMELARVAPGETRTWDTAGLLQFCDTLRQTANADTADAIMTFMRKGERVGYFRIAVIRERALPMES